jgi:hypothetical protein
MKETDVAADGVAFGSSEGPVDLVEFWGDRNDLQRKEDQRRLLDAIKTGLFYV